VVFLLNGGVSGVAVADTAAIHQVSSTIPVGVSPTAVAVDATTDTIYAANRGGAVSVIDGVTGSVSSTIPVGGAPPRPPFTGSDLLPWAIAGILTLLAGAVLLTLAAQRRRRAA
jgi:YVTN family beta-propeller protein